MSDITLKTLIITVINPIVIDGFRCQFSQLDVSFVFSITSRHLVLKGSSVISWHRFSEILFTTTLVIVLLSALITLTKLMR
uniref:Uncharacterized protein n=1 Tax=Lepeophtheirus salmonis TaxID=72036 RepID=A0A0K2VED8_LEPSM